MEIATLNAFVAVAKRQSFSKAAEQLHLTQPAISKRIASLEQELGKKLFDRIGHHIVLTDAGHILLPKAEEILATINDSRIQINNLSNSIAGQLSVATSHHIGLHRLPNILRQFTSLYADVELDLQFMDSEQGYRAVEQGEQELALITLPEESSTLELIDVWTDQLVVTVSPTHPLAKEKTITPEILTHYPAILPARGTYTRELIEQQLGIQFTNTKLETHYLETIKMMVTVGMGWSLWPDNMIEEELKPKQAKGIVVKRKLGIARHPQRTLSNAAKAFIEVCLKDSVEQP